AQHGPFAVDQVKIVGGEAHTAVEVVDLRIFAIQARRLLDRLLPAVDVGVDGDLVLDVCDRSLAGEIANSLLQLELLERAFRGRVRLEGLLVGPIGRQPNSAAERIDVIVHGERLVDALARTEVAVTLVVAYTYHDGQRAGARTYSRNGRTQSAAEEVVVAVV